MSRSQQQSILVIDDEEPVLHLIRSLLAGQGLACRGVSDPEEALSILAAEAIDLVISDAHLPPPGSLAILESARRSRGGVPVVFTTRHQSITPPVRALVAGAFEVLKKPFELSRLPAVVGRALERQRLVRENESLTDRLALYEIVTAVNASIEEQEILQIGLASVERAFAVDRVRLFGRRPGQKRLTHWNSGAFYADPLAAVEERIVTRVVDEDTALLVPGEAADAALLFGQAHSALAFPLRGRTGIVGAVVVIRKAGPWGFTPQDLATLELLTVNLGAVMERATRTRRAIENRTGVSESDPSMIGDLVMALDAREHEASGHSARVAEYALRLAGELCVPPAALVDLKFGALLHDIGKIGVRDDILLKAGPLTEEERDELERHPGIGHDILRGIHFIRNAAEIVLCHHERFDGSGYPRGLSSSEIPLGARIVGVVDTFEAMTHVRPYRQSLTYTDAVEELTRRSARQFDPSIVDAFLRIPESEWELIQARVAEGHGQDTIGVAQTVASESDRRRAQTG